MPKEGRKKFKDMTLRERDDLRKESFLEYQNEKKWEQLELRGLTRPANDVENSRRLKEAHGY